MKRLSSTFLNEQMIVVNILNFFLFAESTHLSCTFFPWCSTCDIFSCFAKQTMQTKSMLLLHFLSNSFLMCSTCLPFEWTIKALAFVKGLCKHFCPSCMGSSYSNFWFGIAKIACHNCKHWICQFPIAMPAFWAYDCNRMFREATCNFISLDDKLTVLNWNRIGVINPLSVAAHSQVGKHANAKSVQMQVNWMLWLTVHHAKTHCLWVSCHTALCTDCRIEQPG